MTTLFNLNEQDVDVDSNRVLLSLEVNELLELPNL